MFCLKKASQATKGANVIWALELGENPKTQDVSSVRDLFLIQRIKYRSGSYSFSDLVPPKDEIPGDWNQLIKPQDIRLQLEDFSAWKKYFNFLISFYLAKAEEFAQKQTSI
jgi:hypothetical protein